MPSRRLDGGYAGHEHGAMQVPPPSEPVDASFERALLQELSKLPSAVHQLCQRQEIMESRLESVITAALERLSKRLEDSWRGGAHSSHQTRQQNFCGGITEATSVIHLGEMRTASSNGIPDNLQDAYSGPLNSKQHSSPSSPGSTQLSSKRAVFTATKPINLPPVASDLGIDPDIWLDEQVPLGRQGHLDLDAVAARPLSQLGNCVHITPQVTRSLHGKGSASSIDMERIDSHLSQKLDMVACSDSNISAANHGQHSLDSNGLLARKKQILRQFTKTGVRAVDIQTPMDTHDEDVEARTTSVATSRYNVSKVHAVPPRAHTMLLNRNNGTTDFDEKAAEVKEALQNIKGKHIDLVAPSIPIYGDTSKGYKETLAKVVKHPCFDSLCACVILLNTLMVGIITERLTDQDEETPWMLVVTHFCNVFFTVELILRMVLNGRMYFLGPDRAWNVFDFILVVFALADIIMFVSGSGGGAKVGSAFKTIKMVRILRIFRVFRFFRELSMLAIMIADSLKALVWALTMLSIIVYVFAIYLTSGACDYIKEHPTDSKKNDIVVKWGSTMRSVDSLVMSMLGGVSWGEVSAPLIHIGWDLFAPFYFYIFFTMLAVLNIITGVFVDNAVETAKTQREFLVQKEMELKDKFMVEMRDLFVAMDMDGSGTITVDELRYYFEDDHVSSYFQVLGMDPTNLERLFGLIDIHGSGEVELQEFLDGCIRLKGEARSIDVHALLFESKAIWKTLLTVKEQLASEVNLLKSVLEASSAYKSE